MATHFPRLPRALFAVTIVSVFLLAGTASAQDAPPAGAKATDVERLERRIQELEAIVRRLEVASQPAAAPPPTIPQPEGTPAPTEQGQPAGQALTGENQGGTTSEGGTKASGSPVAGWENGFFLRSTDKNYQLRITGQIQGDVRDYTSSRDQTDIDTFLIRRARFGIEATVFQYYEFRFLPDFGQGRTVIQDAYINVHYLDDVQFTGGKFKEPFSYEQLVQDRFVPTVERSIIDQLAPARDVGVMIHGQKLLNDRLDYAVGIFNGEINGDQDVNNNKDIAGRVALRPFNSPEFPQFLRLLQGGIAVTTGVEREPITPAALRTPANVPWFQFNANVRADGVRNRYSPELAYFYRGFGFMAQYFHMDQDIAPAPVNNKAQPRVHVPFEGFQVTGTYLLTGEERTTYSAPVVPLHPFDPFCPLASPGAWELVGRVSRLHVGDVAFVPGAANLANPANFSDGVTELTFGFNWYLNAWVRMQFNWEHAMFDRPVRLGTGPTGLLNQEDSLLARLQIIF